MKQDNFSHKEQVGEDITHQAFWSSKQVFFSFISVLLLILAVAVGYYALENEKEYSSTDTTSSDANRLKTKTANQTTTRSGKSVLPYPDDVVFYNEVLQEDNGFDPYLHNPQDQRKTLSINGLNLSSITITRINTLTTFANDGDSDDIFVSGTFDLTYDDHGGRTALYFYPDPDSQKILPWPSTKNTPSDQYFVEDFEIKQICDSECQANLQDSEHQRVMTFEGGGEVRTVTLEVYNGGAGTIGDMITFDELELEQTGTE